MGEVACTLVAVLEKLIIGTLLFAASPKWNQFSKTVVTGWMVLA